MKKKLIVLTMAVLMVLTTFGLTGCGSSDFTPVDEMETLRVGLDDSFPPMGFRDSDGDLIGFDIDLATALCEEWGIEVEFVPIVWESMTMELESKNIDCVWNGMSITPERLENLELTDKYLNNKIVLMSLADGGVDVTDPAQLADLNVGTQAGSAALDMLRANEEYESFKDKVVEYETYTDAIMDLKAGRLDVIAVDQVLGEYTNNNLGGEMKECTYSLGDDYYVIGVAKGNTDLRDKLNELLKTLVDNGKAAEISEEWFGRDIVVFEPLES